MPCFIEESKFVVKKIVPAGRDKMSGRAAAVKENNLVQGVTLSRTIV